MGVFGAPQARTAELYVYTHFSFTNIQRHIHQMLKHRTWLLTLGSHAPLTCHETRDRDPDRVSVRVTRVPYGTARSRPTATPGYRATPYGYAPPEAEPTRVSPSRQRPHTASHIQDTCLSHMRSLSHLRRVLLTFDTSVFARVPASAFGLRFRGPAWHKRTTQRTDRTARPATRSHTGAG